MSTALTEAIQASDAAAKAAREFYAAHSTEEIAASDDLLKESEQHNRKMADLSVKAAKIQDVENGRSASTKERESAGRAVNEDDGEVKPSATKAFDPDEAWASSEGLKAVQRDPAKFKGTVELVDYPIKAFKATLTLGDMTPRSDRRPFVASAQDETTVGDLVLQGTTDSNVISYYEETTFTNAADTVAEDADKPESALDFTEVTDTVRKIATWIPATSEFLEDNAGIRSYIEGRLRFMVERTEEDQLLNGNGTAPNISGILDRSIQTIGSTNDIDAIYQAMTEVRVDGQAEPTAVVIHPLSWQKMRLSKDDNNQYLGPGPFSPDNVERIWGLQVRVTPLIAEGTALVGAFRPYAQVFRKGGIRVVASTEHASYFIANRVAILAEERLALAVYRPTAFCSVTGLASS
jgi:HK97 family phage major capsid protein